MHSKRRLSEAPAACYVKKLHMRPYVVTKRIKHFYWLPRYGAIMFLFTSNFSDTKTSNDTSENKLLICITVTGI